MTLEGEKPIKPKEAAEAKEKIVSAAIEYKNKIYTGILHTVILEEVIAEHPELTEEGEDCRFGFVTTTGRFLDRDEAMGPAIQAGQVRDRFTTQEELSTEFLKPEIMYPDRFQPAERITSAAIKYKDEIFSGRTHAHAWRDMTAKYPETVMLDDRGDGFLTNTGRFVDRKEALEMAEKAEQLAEPREDVGGLLSSEDLKNTDE